VDLKQPDVKFWLLVVDVREQHGLGDASMVRETGWVDRGNMTRMLGGGVWDYRT